MTTKCFWILRIQSNLIHHYDGNTLAFIFSLLLEFFMWSEQISQAGSGLVCVWRKPVVKTMSTFPAFKCILNNVWVCIGAYNCTVVKLCTLFVHKLQVWLNLRNLQFWSYKHWRLSRYKMLRVPISYATICTMLNACVTDFSQLSYWKNEFQGILLVPVWIAIHFYIHMGGTLLLTMHNIECMLVKCFTFF